MMRQEAFWTGLALGLVLGVAITFVALYWLAKNGF